MQVVPWHNLPYSQLCYYPDGAFAPNRELYIVHSKAIFPCTDFALAEVAKYDNLPNVHPAGLVFCDFWWFFLAGSNHIFLTELLLLLLSMGSMVNKGVPQGSILGPPLVCHQQHSKLGFLQVTVCFWQVSDLSVQFKFVLKSKIPKWCKLLMFPILAILLKGNLCDEGQFWKYRMREWGETADFHTKLMLLKNWKFR